MKRRLLSAFLAVMMVLTMAPVAFAANGDAENTADGSASAGTGSSEVTSAVAEIGNAEYPTLQAAVDAANNGDTIVLKKPISATEIGEKKQLQFVKADMNVTLDLNQNTITAEAGEAIAINAANITLTVKNGTIENFAEGNYSDGVYAYKESNNLTLTFENIVLKSRTQGLAVQGLTSNSNVNIVNSKITSAEELGIYYPPKSGTLTINDSEITGVTGIVVKGSNLVVKGEKTIISGTGPNVDPETYYTGATDGSSALTETGDALYIESGYNDRDITVAVEGGSFTSANAQAVRMFIKNGETTSVKREVKVTGGTFSSDVSAYVAEGYVQNENGTVEQLGETNAVAKIGDTYYKTLADAYAALPRNAGTDSEPTTITVLKDSEGKAIGSDSDKGMNYVIDFDGHTYTVGKPAVGSTGTETQGLRVLKGSKAVFKNGTLKAVNYPDMKMPVHTYGDVTFEDFTVDATEDSYAQIAYEIDNGSLNMLGNSSILAYPGKIGLYVSFWPRGGYTDGTTVNIDTTGKITGKMVYEWDDKADTAEQQKENKAVLNIKNGNFDITNIQTLFTSSLPSNLKVPKIYISGGYFTVDPSAYCVTGKTGVPSNRTDEYAWTVGEKSETKAEVATGEPTVDASKVAVKTEEDKALLNATKSALSSTEVEGNGIATAAAAAANNNTVTADETVVNQLKKATKDNAVTAENTNIVIQTYMDMTITGVNASSEKKTITVDIQPMYRTVATTANVKNGDEIVLTGDESKAVNAVQIGNPQKLEVSGETTVSIQLPNGFVTDATAKIFVQHKGHEYDATVTEANGKYTATFTNPHGFSPFTISKTSQTVATIGTDKYTSFADAVSAVPANGTIEITGGTSPYTGTANKTFTVKNSTSADITVNGQTIKPTESYTFKYTHSSGGSSGGSSSGKTTYKVNTSAVNNGGVNASPSNAEKGATITITLSPDKGYKLDKLTVTDGSGKSVSTVKKSDTVYTFTMPASAVTVGVSYAKADETPSKTTFNDVSANDWFASAVDYVTGKGMMNGTAANTFSPKANTTRGMLMTVLARHAGEDTTGGSVWYEKGMNWAKANGVSDGTNPQVNITREQLAAMLYRYAQNKKYDVSGAKSLDGYTDAQSVSSYAVPALQWANAAGVVNGKSGSKLDPKGYATRAEVAAMLMRFCENVEK